MNPLESNLKTLNNLNDYQLQQLISNISTDLQSKKLSIAEHKQKEAAREYYIRELAKRDEQKQITTSMEINIEKLRICLSYDSEKQRFLTLYERCQLQRNQVRLMYHRPLKFTESLEDKINTKLKEIEQSGWIRPLYRMEMDDYGIIKKIRIN